MKDQHERPTKEQRSEQSEAMRAQSMGWQTYLSLCALGLIFALTSIAPSASEGLGTLNAMVFWAAHVVPAIIILASTQVLLGKTQRFSTLPGLVQVVLSAVGASFLFAPVALAIDSFLASDGARDEAGAPLLLLLGSELAHFFVPLVLIWTLINAPSLTSLHRLGRGTVPQLETESSDSIPQKETGTDSTAFWSRVPGRLGRDLVALSAELHYLRVHTTQRETLILFPFGRAVDVLQEENGMQVHRSHWISLDHIDEVVTRDGRTLCRMVGGPSVPVSRSFRAALKAARRGSV